MANQPAANQLQQFKTKLAQPRTFIVPDEIDDEVRQSITSSWGDALDNLQIQALELDEDPADAEALSTARRILHTIKGDSAICGFDDISAIFHEAEDILEVQVADGESAADFLLTLHDWAEKVVATIESGGGLMEPAALCEPAPVVQPDISPAANPDPPTGFKTLIVDDDFVCRTVLQKMLMSFGVSHIAINGREAIDIAIAARVSGQPYDLVCLDIMMPIVDGHQALKEIRAHEDSLRVKTGDRTKILMTTALDDLDSVSRSYGSICDGYLVKPFAKNDLLRELQKLDLAA